METVRSYWVDTMLKIAGPVIFALEKDSLQKQMPVECRQEDDGRGQYTYLEALGRTLCGIASWLACKGLTGGEEQKRQGLAAAARSAIKNAVTPGCSDFMNFETGAQPIVDAAFLCHGLLRAPEELFEPLEKETKKNLILQLKKTRTRKPYHNNWLLFSAMIEAFFYYAGEADWDSMRIDFAVKQHMQWYKGDGIYGDGNEFHFDYYNSFVIQPMLVDILNTVGHEYEDWAEVTEIVKKRFSHYASVLEGLIGPDGSYPVIGRSSAYRFGAFQALSQAALQNLLEPDLSYGQVRCALTAVIQKVMQFENFDHEGWLKIGVCGSQPAIGEPYISTGSLYLCTTVFLPLGLPASHPFWTEADSPWTAKKIWSGENCVSVHSI
ncbi:DUF2264 domain-containing protein [Congzhengia sp.]|uniref:DUF2264 domain-containing protein n=1 Tax=Congzhengia sp. TaxID=2944168 RepID=UPI0030769E5E